MKILSCLFFSKMASVGMLAFCTVFPLVAAPVEEYGKTVDAALSGSATVISGETLFMTVGSESFAPFKALCSVDISKADAPKLLCSLPLKGFPQDIAVADGKIYLVNGRSLLVIDAAKPSELKLISELLIDDDPVKGPVGIGLKDKLAFIACRSAGLKIVDVSEPDKPKLVGACPSAGFARDVTLDASLAYVADDVKGVSVFNIEDPLKPQKISCLPSELGTASRIRVSGKNLFVANGFSQLEILSAAEPQKLKSIGALKGLKSYNCYGSYCYDLDFSGSHAFLAAGEAGVAAIDIKDATAPKLLGICKELQWGAVRSLAIKGKYLYANNDGDGLKVVDISDPENITLVGEGGLKPGK